MAKTISSNQAGLLNSVFTISLKLTALPALLFGVCGNDAYIACLISLVLDFVGTLIILKIMKDNPGTSYFDFLAKHLGRWVAVIMYSLLFIFFFAKCIIALLELHDYYIATLFEDLNPFYFVITLALLLLFLMSKNFRAIGRTVEFCFWPLLIGILFSLIYPIQDMQIFNLLPVLEEGIYPLSQAVLRSTIAFGDFTLLIMLMGKVDLNNKGKKRIVIYFLFVTSFVFNFIMVFIGCFGNISRTQSLALAELPLHNSTPATIGRLEWLTIIIWTTMLLIDTGLLGLCCKKCLNYIFNSFDSKPILIVTWILIVGTLILFFLKLDKVLTLTTSIPFSICAIVFEILILALGVISNIINKHRKLASQIIKPLALPPSTNKEKTRC